MSTDSRLDQLRESATCHLRHLLRLRPVTRDTAAPTMVHGGQRVNVIPVEVVVDIDGRILPGTDPEAFRAEVQRAMGDTHSGRGDS